MTPTPGLLVRGPPGVSACNTQHWPHGICSINVGTYVFPVLKIARVPAQVLGMDLLPNMEKYLPVSTVGPTCPSALMSPV